mmetsp:Transcript_31156/g.74318  ORF Transcript_31156/g.74318 Transcript_31156/m.74318 type:complete len:230 (-) Transcript_31156:405-1094(-)
MGLRDARDACGGVVRQHGSDALPHCQQHLPHEGGGKGQSAGAFETVHEADGQGCHPPQLCVVRPHQGERVDGLLLQRGQLLRHRVRGRLGLQHRALVGALGCLVQEFLRVLHRQGHPIHGEPQGEDLFEVVLQVRGGLGAGRRGRHQCRVADSEAAVLAKDLKLVGFQHGPGRPALHVAVLVLFRRKLHLHLTPYLREQLLRRLLQPFAGSHEDPRDSPLGGWGLGCRC